MLIPSKDISSLNKTLLLFAIIALLLNNSTLVLASENEQQISYIETVPCDYYGNFSFNSTAANESVHWQVELGPRLPGSNASFALRESIKENLTDWTFEEETHYREDFYLTNLIATYKPFNSSSQEIYLVAHYDSRDRAERDDNESLRDIPIDGANDGASATAVLIEMGKIIPQMNLNHTVKLFFTDAEDQGERAGIYGSKAWAENKTDDELSDISAFIVIDMIGDYDLHFTHVWPGTSELWLTIQSLAEALGLVEGEEDCLGNPGVDVFDIDTSHGVIDDHVAAFERGVPAIDIIDIHSGEGAEKWGGYWHTHNDTIDKVSADSLGKIGQLLELGLLSNSWILNSDSNVTAEINETKQNTDVENSFALGIISLSITFGVFLIIFVLDYRIKKI
ncbi:MAG: hypothetical protein CMA81_04945 [Euryarchaeota archaeon]|nr:hypothetical protein [Euryarchaeota archaeon]|tara:strand:- start:8577 stop:9758 length:1182 start_codon:yes stop_codon:yes gene_type:complete